MNYLDNLTARTSTPAEIAQNTNNVKVPSPNINLDSPKDSLCLYEMSEDMELTDYSGGQIYDGKLNGKQANIRSVFTNKDTCEFECMIGDKKLLMTNQGFKKYTGTYNGKEFEIYATRDKNKNYIEELKGTINGEEINLTLKGAPVPKDNDTRDIITTILLSNQNAPFVINGKIANVGMSHASYSMIEANKAKKEKIIGLLLPLAYTAIGALPGIITESFKALIAKNKA